MSKKRDKPAMYFSTLEVENVKSFGKKQILDLKDGNGKLSPWTLILGDNGVGKTTLLKCLSWMIPVEAPPLKSEGTEEMEKSEVNVIIKPFMDDLNESNFEQLIRKGDDIKTSIKITLTNDIELKGTPTDANTISLGMSFEKVGGKLEVITPSLDKLSKFNSPNLFAYSASRHLAFKNIEDSELKDPTSNLFSESGDLYDAEQLLSMLDTASIRQGRKGKATDLLFKVKDILVDLLPDIKSPDNIIINSPINDDGSINRDLVEVRTDDGKVKLFDLSLGYKTMLAWIVDLAVRMLWRFPESIEPLKEPAIVIVDEVDLHLHPIWQRMIRKKLTHHFPATQFICTAHSPFMAQSSEMENLCVINRDGKDVCIENEPFIVQGWRIGQIATSELFGIVSERSEDIDEKVEQRRKLLKKATLTAAEQTKLERLNAEIGSLPVGESIEEDQAVNLLRDFAKKLSETKSTANDQDQ
jgi:energy-coupling factor transporter ATP-binding protein EcfA2